MKILVIQNRMGIGDMIMFLPFIKAISNYYGEQVSLMVKKNTKASEYLNEESFYFCGRKPEEDFPYCKLHVLYAFQPKGQKEDVLDKDDEVPEFIEKKVKSAG